ncbi:MAG: hypothetical protein NTW21_35715 [Verrucomicrobia bacterium]|nr:hypothetical protein [Verrucomicrobiota bacterium]
MAFPCAIRPQGQSGCAQRSRPAAPFDDPALRAAVEWSIRYLPDFRLPAKALDLVGQACAAVRLRMLTPVGERNSGGETPPERTGARRASH